MTGRCILALALAVQCAWAGAARADKVRVQQVVQLIRADRIGKDVEDLASLGTRYSLSPNFHKATAMVRKKLETAGLQVQLQPFQLPGVQVSNVLARIKGSVAGRPAIIIGAHYDSLNFHDPLGAAPGAEDNASGTAALLELARVLASQKLATDVLLIAFAGEELGLWGSLHAVKQLRKAAGGLAAVQSAINMDMVGYDPQKERHVLVDTYKLGRGLAARVDLAARAHAPGMKLSAGIFSEGRSDHKPFLDAGVEAVTLASIQWRHYPHYHHAEDRARHVDPQMVAGVARMVAATVLARAGFADGPPVAHAGAFAEATEGQTVTLSGVSSFDPRGQALTHTWTQTGGPVVSTTKAATTLTFTPTEAGTYRFELVVKAADGRTSEPDVVAAVVVEAGGCGVSGPTLGAPASLLLVLLVLIRRRRRG